VKPADEIQLREDGKVGLAFAARRAAVRHAEDKAEEEA
jgi:hypothetical protein